VGDIAEEKHVTPSQVALAWLLAQPGVVPIPGTKHRKYLEENAGALNVRLSESDLRRIDQSFPVGAASGERYPEQALAAVHR
jgi:aryl-alcohol dehydrogenase-like predicted oxidoreductase